jgi:hypothetical protein
MKMVRLQEFKGQFSITIPREFIEKKGWKKGQKLIVSFNERGDIEIQNV